MGAMKELATELALEYHNDKRALKERLKSQSLKDQAWMLSQLGATKNYWDSEGYALHKPKTVQELSDKAFIGGEGIPKFGYKICRQCLWDFNSLLGLSYQYSDGSYRLRSETLPDLVITFQDNDNSRPVDDLERCSCGNWMWDRAGHDLVVEAVARGDMSAEVATAWLNRNFSYELDTRAFNADFIDFAIRDWEARWRA